MKKGVLTIILTGILTISMGITALAGWEQEGTNWKYNDNGTYAANGWKWIDGNNDGIAESYYFDSNGILAKNTTIEGYTVNADGAWVVEGKIQTQSVATNNENAGAADTDNYDPQYPLAGMLDQLGLNFAKDSNGVDMLYWSSRYQNWTIGYDAAPSFIWQKCKETNNLKYMNIPENYDEMLAIAKLAGMTDINLPYADEAKAEALANNIREFLKTFSDWRTASDLEKAVHITKWITQAEYDKQTHNEMYNPEAYNPEEVGENIHTSYGCLINKQCVCDGYTSAAQLLAACVDLEYMPAVELVYMGHVYPVFKINGIWLSCEPTQGKDITIFEIYDVYYQSPNDAVFAGKRRTEEDVNKEYAGNRSKFFYDRNYVVPTRLNGKFDSSLISHVGRYRDHLDFGLYENSGETSAEDAVKIKDPCGYFH